MAESSRLRVLMNFKHQLEARRDRLTEEIGAYPSPIPACDAQFNYLLEERSKIAGKLKIVEDLLARCRTDRIEIEAIDKRIAMERD